MARSRMGYLLALLGAWSFFLFFNGYFSFYILILAAVFPLFSLLVSLPGMLAVRSELIPSSLAVRRGDGLSFDLAVSNLRRLPVGRLSARMTCANLLSGRTARFRRQGAGSRLTLDAELAEAHCGLIRCEVTSLKVCDLLGLFSLSLPQPRAAEVLSLPLELPAEEIPFLLGEGEGDISLVPRPGGGPGEDYDLRPYRPGDPLRSVHWKLSSKVDELVVRETMEPARLQLLLTYDHFGPPGELDLVLDRLDAVSRALIAHERSHAISWADPVTGAVQRMTVSSLRDLRAFEHAAFSIPAPPTGRSILDQAGLGGEPNLRHLHVRLPEKGGVEA